MRPAKSGKKVVANSKKDKKAELSQLDWAIIILFIIGAFTFWILCVVAVILAILTHTKKVI